MAVPLDARWSLAVAGPIALDGGHTGYFQSWTHGSAEAVADLRAAASVPIRRRFALSGDGAETVVHESHASPVDGGEVLLWPPIVGPTGVLLRHAIERDDGREALTEPRPPWLVRRDGTVAQLPFELGVSPLTAMPDGRWLLPGADTVWRDDYDEPLSLLAADGSLEPLRIAGRPVPVSRVLREAAPDLLDALGPVGRDEDVPWGTVGARLLAERGELRLVVEIDRGGQTAVILAALPLDGSAPARLLEHLEPAPGRDFALAP